MVRYYIYNTHPQPRPAEEPGPAIASIPAALHKKENTIDHILKRGSGRCPIPSRTFPPLYTNLSAYPHCLLDFFETTTLVVLVHPTTHFY